MIGENNTFVGGEAYLKQKGIELVILQNKECERLMQKFISEKPEIWWADFRPVAIALNQRCENRNEDIGV